MKTRIISAAAAIAVLGAVMYLGREAVGFAVFILAFAGMYEFYDAMRKKGFNPVSPAGYICCLPLLYLPFMTWHTNPEASLEPLYLTVMVFLFMFFLLLAILFCMAVFSSEVYNISDMAVTLFGVFYIVFLISFVTLIRDLEKGGYTYG